MHSDLMGGQQQLSLAHDLDTEQVAERGVMGVGADNTDCCCPGGGHRLPQKLLFSSDCTAAGNLCFLPMYLCESV